MDDLDLPSVSMPTTVEEEQLRHPFIPEEADDVEPDSEFQVIEGASQRGKPLLIDNQGYSYTQARVGKTVTAWRCSVRSSSKTCPATVQQRGEKFSRGPQPHSHSGNPGAAAKARITVEVKEQASTHMFEPALNIVETAIRMETEEFGVRPGLPNPQNLCRLANYTRDQQRPEEPTDLNFDYNKEYIPDFCVADITVDDKRHLLFATQQQLDVLRHAKRWYLDGTFKVVREPFVQLWSIHAFVCKDKDMKQLPLLFVFMSSRRTMDYNAVFQTLSDLLGTPVPVEEMVLDFELSLWKSIKICFPDVTVKGCAFHWSQSVWRRIQQVGLQSSYMQVAGVYQLCKQLLGLPFIPAQHIRPVFEKLQERATTPKLQELMDYVQMTWIDSLMWTPESWSVFGQSVRTNNDVEGWHHRLNAKAKKSNLPFYNLLELLHDEAKMVNINLHLINEK